MFLLVPAWPNGKVSQMNVPLFYNIYLKGIGQQYAWDYHYSSWRPPFCDTMSPVPRRGLAQSPPEPRHVADQHVLVIASEVGWGRVYCTLLV